jgi:hypothetical protein
MGCIPVTFFMEQANELLLKLFLNKKRHKDRILGIFSVNHLKNVKQSLKEYVLLLIYPKSQL